MFSSLNLAKDIAIIYRYYKMDYLNRLISAHYSRACVTLLWLRMGKQEEIETEQAIWEYC